jgi:GxxExxY protein
MAREAADCADVRVWILSQRVIGACLRWLILWGLGFLEKVYEWALLRKLASAGIQALAQESFSVLYQGLCVGEYFADILVEGAIVIELN